MNPIRILIVDDHGIVRDGLRALINAEPDLHVVAEAEDAPSALRYAAESPCDVGIIDISLPGMSGIDLIGRLRELNNPANLLVLSANEDRGYIQHSLKMGARGYLAKRSAADELIKAIRVAATGGRYISTSLVNGLVDDLFTPRPAPASGPVETLSEREREVLRMIAEGLTNKEIAARLDISIKTVETYKARSTQKLNLRGRADIVRFALSQGWLQDLA